VKQLQKKREPNIHTRNKPAVMVNTVKSLLKSLRLDVPKVINLSMPFLAELFPKTTFPALKKALSKEWQTVLWQVILLSMSR
jgi:hypothetical protein